jgi:hypothetical protein
LVRLTLGFEEVESHIIGISKSSLREPDVLSGKEELVLDAMLLAKVLQAPNSTVKSIPHGCRLAFSQILKDVLYKVVAEPNSVSAWIRLLLFPRCTLQVVKPQNRRDRRSGNRKSLQKHHILSCLATWREANGVGKLVDGVLASSGHEGQGYGRDNCEEKNKGKGINIKQCLRKVADGHFTAAVKVLGSSGVAPYNGDTLKVLGDKHPHMPPPSMPTIAYSDVPLLVDGDTVLKCIKCFPKGTSCGRDGLRAQHLLDAMCGDGSAVARDLLGAITLVVNLWLGGRCPMSLSEFVAFAPLTVELSKRAARSVSGRA